MRESSITIWALFDFGQNFWEVQLPEEMATADDVKKLCRFLLCKNVIVAPQDKVKKLLEKLEINQYIICNSAPSGLKQGHYIAVVKSKVNKLLVFDPLASPLTLKCFEKIFGDYDELYFVKKAVQDDMSNLCSLFVAGFLEAFKNNKIIPYFKKFKKRNLKQNDAIIYQHLKKILKKKQKLANAKN